MIVSWLAWFLSESQIRFKNTSLAGGYTIKFWFIEEILGNLAFLGLRLAA
jgi:hypothetical protein